MRAAPQKDQAAMRSLETSASPLHSLEKGQGLKMELIIDQASVRKIRIVWGLESFQVGGHILTGRGRTLSPRGQRLSGRRPGWLFVSVLQSTGKDESAFH